MLVSVWLGQIKLGQVSWVMLGSAMFFFLKVNGGKAIEPYYSVSWNFLSFIKMTNKSYNFEKKPNVLKIRFPEQMWGPEAASISVFLGLQLKINTLYRISGILHLMVYILVMSENLQHDLNLVTGEKSPDKSPPLESPPVKIQVRLV